MPSVTSTSIPAMGSAAFGGLETREPLTEAQIDGIARGLLAQLTLEEKIGMMSGDTPFFQGMLHLNRNGYFRQPRTTAGAIPRLGIPGVRFSDGPRGFHGEGATTFPQGSARGASWDPNLEERVGDVMGREARAHGSNMIGAPCINLLRHPAWGRAQEGYGEDSFHLGEMGAALVRGIQRHVMACPKHFALNSMENGRFKLESITCGLDTSENRAHCVDLLMCRDHLRAFPVWLPKLRHRTPNPHELETNGEPV